MKRHIVYIPGLGDQWDPFRRLALWFWKRKGLNVTLVSMYWSVPDETYEQKIVRIKQAIDAYPEREVTIVGESAGGAVAIAVYKRYRDHIANLVTVCGMNQGESNVHASRYRKNPAFRAAMQAVDQTLPILSDEDREGMLTIYSSLDTTIESKHTLIDRVKAYDLKVSGHLQAIAIVLIFRSRLVIGK